MIFIRYFKFSYISRTYRRIDPTNAREIIDQIKYFPSKEHITQYDFLLYIINTVIYIKLI